MLSNAQAGFYVILIDWLIQNVEVDQNEMFMSDYF